MGLALLGLGCLKVRVGKNKKNGTGICLIFEWENGIGLTGTGMP